MAWPGLGKCTAYPRPGQDSPPLGVRWFSEGLGVSAPGFGDGLGLRTSLVILLDDD